MRPRPTPCKLVLLLVSSSLFGGLGGCRCQDKGGGAGAPAGAGRPSRGGDRVDKLLTRIREDEWRRVSAASIREGLSDPAVAVRRRAALAAGRIGARSNATRLLALVGADADAKVRGRAVFALRLLVRDADPEGTIAGKVARALVARLANEDAPDVRRELIVSVGWTADGGSAPAALALVTPLLGSTVSADLAPALTAAGLLGKRKLLDAGQRAALGEALRPSLEHAEPGLRLLATWARARLGLPPTPADLAALRRVADRVGERTLEAIEARAWALRTIGQAKLEQLPKLVDWLAEARMRDPDVGPQIEAIRALAGGGPRAVVKLCGALDELWRSIGQSHFRLTGRRLRSMLVALDALRPHARLATVRRFARAMLELSDASDAAVRYSPIEAHSVDLVHCAAARLFDLGVGRTAESPTCGTARAASVTAGMRRTWLVQLIGEMRRPADWKLTLLRRYLDDDDVAVRAAAVEALAKADSPAAAAPLARAVADRDPGVLGAAALTVAARAEQLSLDGRKKIGEQLAARLAGLSPLAQPDVTCDLVKGLAAVGRGSTLQRLLVSPAWAVRDCARGALARAGAAAKEHGTGHGSRGLPELKWSGDRPPPRKAVLVTHKGEIFIELFAEEAPATAANLARLATKRFYRKIRFHREVPGFVIQGGDPRGDGRGGPGYTIACELTPRPYVRGSVGMALSGRDTGGSQFFITLSRQPHLDGRYTQLGRVTKGMDVVDRLHAGDEIKDLYIP